MEIIFIVMYTFYFESWLKDNAVSFVNALGVSNLDKYDYISYMHQYMK